MQSEHSSHGPSAWPRLVRCPGAFRAAEGLPDDASWEAAEGTAFHDMLASCLQQGFDPWQFAAGDYVLEVDGWNIAIDEDMAAHAENLIRGVREYEDDPEWTTYHEMPVDISPWAGPGQKGTADYVAVNVKARRVVVLDWKYGRGLPVVAQDPEYGVNLQLLGYALGVWQTSVYRLMADSQPGSREQLPDCTFTLGIEQPRIEIGGGRVEMHVSELVATGAKVAKRLDYSRKDEAPRVAGETQCQFCLAVGKCRENADWVISAFDEDDRGVEGLAEIDGALLEFGAEYLTPEQRGHALRLKPFVEKWFKRVHADAHADAIQGRQVPGMKLIEGRAGKRDWVDGPGPVRQLTDVLPDPLDAWERRLVTPARAEKLIGKQEFANRLSGYVKQADRKPALVSESHPAPAIVSALEEFDDLTDTSDPL